MDKKVTVQLTRDVTPVDGTTDGGKPVKGTPFPKGLRLDTTREELKRRQFPDDSYVVVGEENRQGAKDAKPTETAKKKD